MFAADAAAGGCRDGAGEEVIKVGARVAGRCPPRSGDAKPGEERLGVRLRSGSGSGRRGGFGLAWGQAEDVCLDQLDGALEVGDTGGLEAVVGFGDKLFDLGLVVLEKRVDVCLVNDTGALGLG